MRLVDAAHHSEVMIQCTIALCGFLDLEGRLAGWWFKCRAGTCMGGVGMLACLYRASWCSLPAMINNTACYYYMHAHIRKLAYLDAYRSFTGRINKHETVFEPLWLFFAASIVDMIQCALSSA